MSLVLAYPPLVWPSETGNISIDVTIKCTGEPATTKVSLLIYEGALWGSPGNLIMQYTQDVVFAKDEQKTITFNHTIVPSSATSRDVGVEISIEGVVVASQVFQDLYSVGALDGGGGGITDMLGGMMGIMMMAMVMPMMTGIMGEETEESEGGTV